jgi:hypothetical protein
MQVVQIGDVTTGKKCWVSHLYDSTLGTEKTEITVMLCSHRFKIVNADGFEIISAD